MDAVTKGMDTARFLKSNGIDLDSPTRALDQLRSSSSSWEAWSENSLLGKRPGPTYRSINVAQRPSFEPHIPFAHAASPLSKDLSWDSFGPALQQPGKGLQKFGLETPGLQKPRTSGLRAPAFSTRAQPPLLGARVFDVDGDYDTVLANIRSFASQEGIFGLKIEEEAAFVEASWNSERHMQDATFTLKIYEVTPGQHALEFVRRDGSGFAFNDLMERAQRIIGSGTPPLPMPRLGEIPDTDFMDLDSYDITEDILEEQTDIMRNGIVEVLEHEMQVIAKTAAQKNCAQMWQGTVGEKFIEALVDTFTKSTNGCVCRHSRKAITRLQEAGLRLGRNAKDAVEGKIRQLDQRN